VTYPGGKAGAGVYQQIINQIPPHRVYIEPFLGAGAVLLHKKPAIVTIGIDSDAGAIVSMLGKNSDIAGVPGVIIKLGDAISFLSTYQWLGDEFVYCDPPYLFETRSSKRTIYNNEFGDTDQHKELLSLLLTLPCYVAISGYHSSLYAEMLAGWRTISYQTRTRGGNTVREWLWMNYAAPLELHDYRYLGNNFRERERIKRIKTRWIARLARMKDLERYAMLSTIAEYSGRIPQTNSKTALKAAMMATQSGDIANSDDITRAAPIINSDAGRQPSHNIPIKTTIDRVSAKEPMRAAALANKADTAPAVSQLLTLRDPEEG